MTIQVNNVGIYKALVAQLDKLSRHNRQGSFRTKERYYEAVKRFCAFLADAFRLQKLENISAKHLVAYVVFLQEHDKSASTVKTDLAAIRFFHDKMSSPQYKLPANNELGVELERRRFGQVDRTWSNVEFNRMLGRALNENRYDYILAMYLARYAGLRLHESFRIDTAIAEQMFREGVITFKGKGGKVRTVSVNEQTAIAMREQLKRTKRGHKLLVPDDMPADYAMNQMQFFIRKNRKDIQEDESGAPLTYHGLRHTYAAEKYQEFITNGMTPLDAHFAVSNLLGHERSDVTDIYLASLVPGKCHGK